MREPVWLPPIVTKGAYHCISLCDVNFDIEGETYADDAIVRNWIKMRAGRDLPSRPFEPGDWFLAPGLICFRHFEHADWFRKARAAPFGASSWLID